MQHTHVIIDKDNHFRIDPVTRKILPETHEKNKLVEGDHNSEKYTFDIPQFIEGHDMSQCNSVQIHYLNVSSDKSKKIEDIWEVTDLGILATKPETLFFSWTIKETATKYNGLLSFAIVFKCVTGDVIDYAWHTEIYTGISIGKSMNHSEVIVEQYSDILAKWKEELFSVEGKIQSACKESLDSIEKAKRDSLKSIAEHGTVQVSNEEPTDPNVDLYINPDENVAFLLPEINDDAVSKEDTWSSEKIASELDGFNPSDYYTKDEVDKKINTNGNYIVCWGDSLTAGGGWTKTLEDLSGMPVYNGGTGGENARTIVAQQGADIMMIDGVTIPATTDPVTIATRTGDTGITTYEGYKVTPLLHGGAHVNPVKIGDIEGTLKWTGSNYADATGTWTFTRNSVGDAVAIDRPTAIRTEFDRNKNAPYLMVIFMGQNGGYTNNDDLIRQHRLMIEHARTKNFVVLGLSSGTAVQRKEYENAMKKEFGRYFISLREYLAHPIYKNGEIVSCYGLADQNLNVDPSYSYNGKTTLQEITEGTVPHQILADGVHYTAGTKTVIGNMLYKKCCELGIF